MVRAEFYLAWKVEEDVVVLVKLLQLLLQPVIVGLEVFHAVEHPTVRTKAKLVHYILQFD